MKTFSRVIAVAMIVAMLAAVMTACKAAQQDDRLVGTWKQTDEVDGDWTWTFDSDGKCTLTGDTTGFSGTGTYKLDNNKIHINLDAWSSEEVFVYAVTDIALDLEGLETSYYLVKQ